MGLNMIPWIPQVPRGRGDNFLSKSDHMFKMIQKGVIFEGIFSTPLVQGKVVWPASIGGGGSVHPPPKTATIKAQKKISRA